MSAATRPVRAPLDRSQLSGDHLWSQKEAAYFLGVSARYLRESRCPKILLPGNGKKGQPIVRYRPADVIAWADNWRCGSSASRSA